MGAAEFKPSGSTPGLSLDTPSFTPQGFQSSAPSFQPAPQPVQPQVMNATANSFYPSSQNHQQPPPPQYGYNPQYNQNYQQMGQQSMQQQFNNNFYNQYMGEQSQFVQQQNPYQQTQQPMMSGYYQQPNQSYYGQGAQQQQTGPSAYTNQNGSQKQAYQNRYNNQGGYNTYQNKAGQPHQQQQTYQQKKNRNFDNKPAPKTNMMSNYNPDIDKGMDDWDGPQVTLANNRMTNVPLQTTQKQGLSLNTKPFIPPSYKSKPAPEPVVVPPPPPPVDKVLEGLKKLGVTSDDDITIIKDLLKQLKKDGPIDLELFQKFGEQNICKPSEQDNAVLKGFIQEKILVREIIDEVPEKRGRKPFPPKPKPDGWRPVDDEDRKKLRGIALATQQRISGKKNETQQIRLIINVIAPDTFDKKFGELRQYLFNDLKTVDECFNQDIQYDESIHKLQSDDMIDEVLLDTIVNNVVRKAQKETEFCIFYGELCEKLIKTELDLRGEKKVRSNMKKSILRAKLIHGCKMCFEKFFEMEERDKRLNDPETAVEYQMSLHGIIEFVGELFRRQILSESTLVGVFESLFDPISDFTVEAAIILMNKVGSDFEEVCRKKSEKKDKKSESNEFEKIIDKFKKIVFEDDKNVQKIEFHLNKSKNTLDEKQFKTFLKNFQKDFNIKLPEDVIANKFKELDPESTGKVAKPKIIEFGRKYVTEISNRIKILIKNMFDDHSNNWERCKKKNEAGPKKVAEVRQEVEAQYEEERKKQEAARRDRDYHEDRHNDRRGSQRYQKKDTQTDKQGGTYGSGGRENRDRGSMKDRRKSTKEPEVQIVQISINDVGNLVKKNFEEFVIKQRDEADEQEDEEEQKGENKKLFDISIYRTMNRKNGRSYEDIFYGLLTKVFDEDEQKMEAHFIDYLDQIIKQKIMRPPEFSSSISRFIQLMPELALDVPQIHEYLFKYVIKPLIQKKQMDLKFLQFDLPKPKTEDEDDDDEFGFDSSNSMFLLLAYLLKFQRDQLKSWSRAIEWFDNLKLGKKQLEKIEDPDDFWDQVRDEVGEFGEEYEIIVPILMQDKAAVEKALKDLN